MGLAAGLMQVVVKVSDVAALARRFEASPREAFEELTGQVRHQLEEDLALLHLAGLSTRMLPQVSRRVLGIRVSAQEVSNGLHTSVPAAKEFLERPAGRSPMDVRLHRRHVLSRSAHHGRPGADVGGAGCARKRQKKRSRDDAKRQGQSHGVGVGV